MRLCRRLISINNIIKLHKEFDHIFKLTKEKLKKNEIK